MEYYVHVPLKHLENEVIGDQQARKVYAEDMCYVLLCQFSKNYQVPRFKIRNLPWRSLLSIMGNKHVIKEFQNNMLTATLKIGRGT